MDLKDILNPAPDFQPWAKSFRVALPSNTSPRLPQKIIDMIIRNFSNDRRSLVKCSAVARSFIPVSRHYLYHRILVRATQAESLSGLIDSPLSTIKPHIRCVTLGNRGTFHLVHVRPILTLPNLTMLRFGTPWKYIAEDTFGYILSYGLPKLTVLSLECLSFKSVHQFVGFMSSFPALRILELDVISFQDTGDLPVLPPRVRMQVQKLCVNNNQYDKHSEVRLWNWLLALPRVWPIDSFKVGPLADDQETMDKVWQFVQTMKPTLKDLVVCFKGRSRKLFIQTFEFYDFPRLRSIEFPIYTDRPLRIHRFLAPLLLSLPRSMRHIRIILEMSKHAEVENIDWRAFVNLFMTSQLALECVELCVSNYSMGMTGAKAKTGMIRNILWKYGAPSMFVVRPVEALNRNDWTADSSGLMEHLALSQY